MSIFYLFRVSCPFRRQSWAPRSSKYRKKSVERTLQSIVKYLHTTFDKAHSFSVWKRNESIYRFAINKKHLSNDFDSLLCMMAMHTSDDVRNSHLPIFEDEFIISEHFNQPHASYHPACIRFSWMWVQSCRHIISRAFFVLFHTWYSSLSLIFMLFVVDTMIEAKECLTKWICINYVGYLIKIVFIFH